MKQLIKVFGIVSIAAISAQAADSFQLMTSRASGVYDCLYSPANGGTTQCTLTVESEAVVPITLNQAGDGGEYFGSDQVAAGNSQYFLILEANSDKSLAHVTTGHFEPDATGALVGGMTESESSTLSVLVTEPMRFESVDSQTFRIRMGFYSYDPVSISSAPKPLDRQALAQRILKKMKPAFKTILR